MPFAPDESDAGRADAAARARPIVVQKYGGSSMADAEKIRAVAARVMQTKAQGHDVVVVVSPAATAAAPATAPVSGEEPNAQATPQQDQQQPHEKPLPPALIASARVALRRWATG